MYEQSFVLFLWAIMINKVQGYIQCGQKLCHGSTAQCCSWDENECCWLSWYTLWWTWVGAILFMAVLFSMFICCFQNRQRRHGSTRHIIVVGPPPNYTYGSIPLHHQSRTNSKSPAFDSNEEAEQLVQKKISDV